MLLHILLLLAVASLGNGANFSIDLPGKQFLLDGQPFRYVSGSIHYFRVHPDQWDDRLQTIRDLGLSAVEVYVPWNFHETYKRNYSWTGWQDLARFLTLAHSKDLKVILRPGPYICAEWENGGLPYWLNHYKGIKLRSSDENFMAEVRTWFGVLFSIVKPFLIQNDGPIILTQVENEYGAYGCDKIYLGALRDLYRLHLGNEAVLITVNPPETTSCGSVDGVFTTVDFGWPGSMGAMKTFFEIQHQYTENHGGPNVNTENYVGWFATWGEKKPSRPSPEHIQQMTAWMWMLNASFNYYMVFGGTNFGFWNGAESYAPLITSYDYFSPITEAGDPDVAVGVYDLIRKYLAGQPDYGGHPAAQTPAAKPKQSFGTVSAARRSSLMDALDSLVDVDRCQDDVKTFDQLDHPFGYMLYSINVHGPGTLNLTNVKDFAWVWVEDKYRGFTSPNFQPSPKSAVSIPPGHMRMFVENQGRQNYQTIVDQKGIAGPVYLDDIELVLFTSCPLIAENIIIPDNATTSAQTPFQPGDIFQAFFEAPQVYPQPDTWIDMSGWGKGIVFFNDFNLGRYWSSQGPQQSLYVPGPVIRNGTNQVTIWEWESAHSSCAPAGSAFTCSVKFDTKPVPF